MKNPTSIQVADAIINRIPIWESGKWNGDVEIYYSIHNCLKYPYHPTRGGLLCLPCRRICIWAKGRRKD